jgi:hypothetical protein
MKFTFHYPYVILELVPNTVIFSNNATLLLRLLQDLPVYMSSTVCILYETGTAYPSRAHLFSCLPPVVCGRVHVLLYFCVVSSDIQHLSYHTSLRSEFRVVMSATIFIDTTMSCWSLSPVVWRRTRVLFTLFVFGHNDVQHYFDYISSMTGVL